MKIQSASGGSVLVGVLWSLALLSIVVIGVLHTARMDLLAGKNHADRIQARYLALAGIERAKALLHQNARDRSRTRVHHDGKYLSESAEFRPVKLGRGEFSVLRPPREGEGSGWVHAVLDEESLLNANTIGTNELVRIEGMTPDLIGALLDWRDEDDTISPGGAESDYYASLVPPRIPRNGPLDSFNELLMVRGFSEELLYGRVRSKAGSPGSAGGPYENGLSEILTVHSGVSGVNAGGEDRVDLKNADEKALLAVRGITSDIARAIVSHRERNQFNSIVDLLDVGPAVQRGSNSGATGSPGGSSVISEELFSEIMDDLTVDGTDFVPGLININTAGAKVLTCLPGISRELASSIFQRRQANGSYPNVAALLKVPGFTRQNFRELAPRLTARSETFRILGEGKVAASGAVQRIQVTVRIGLKEVKTLEYRELDL